MKLKRKESSKHPISSIVLYIVAILVTLIAIAFLVNNVLLFKNSVAQYVAQGYPSAEVVKQLIPNQLLPGIFEPIAVYGGIAFILFATGIINQKVSKCLTVLAKPEVSALGTDATEQVEAVEEISKVPNETEQSPENK
ncbi:hypothetical protein [Desulfitobacterium sp.]|uniref:hypothetical protein n=1 Tax=Desulfitobacterium sp. TaxID=49981 RepID=UPI002C71A6CD|nr:hypothetical protein [Desulfitobacterium sp.]HVJ48628.1 hypothetical protein [Desulfitobacterium sp.]